MANSKTNTFKQVIKDYLEKKAAQDSLFATTYAKPNKNIEDCCTYIIEEARKIKDGNVAVMDSDAVFSLAVHYYDEDDIVVKKPGGKVQVTTGDAAPEKPKEQEAPKAGRQLTIFDILGE